MSAAYRIEKHQCRQHSLDGKDPLETHQEDSRAEAVNTMKWLADGGLYYAAVFIARDGECIEETADVLQ